MKLLKKKKKFIKLKSICLLLCYLSFLIAFFLKNNILIYRNIFYFGLNEMIFLTQFFSLVDNLFLMKLNRFF